MLRSMYSGVAGLKTHQTKMDVIGNNIANVNTTSFKSQNISFSDLMYQTTQNASGATETTGGVNARQIGLGAQSAAIATAIETQGATQTTNNPYDLMISGNAFFIVNDGTQNVYTRDGSFYVDGQGNLATQSDGYYVMGWMAVTDEDTGVTSINTNGGLSSLQIMSDETNTFPPEGTSQAVISGNIDAKDSNITSSAGKTIALEFYDNLGYLYTAEFTIKDVDDELNTYTMTLTDIMDSDGNSVGAEQLAMVHLGNDTQAGVTTQVPGVLAAGYYVSSYSASKGTADFSYSDSDTTTTDTVLYSGVPTSGSLSDLDDAGVLYDLYKITIDDETFFDEDTYTMDELGNLTISHISTTSTTTTKSVVDDTTTTSYAVTVNGTTATVSYTTTTGTLTSDSDGGKYTAIASALKTAYSIPTGLSSSTTYHTTDGSTVILTVPSSTTASTKSDYTVSVTSGTATITYGTATTATASVSGNYSKLSETETVLGYYGLTADTSSSDTYVISSNGITVTSTVTGTLQSGYTYDSSEETITDGTNTYEDVEASGTMTDDIAAAFGISSDDYDEDDTYTITESDDGTVTISIAHTVTTKLQDSTNVSANVGSSTVTYTDSTNVKTYTIDSTGDLEDLESDTNASAILAAFGLTSVDDYESDSDYSESTYVISSSGLSITTYKDTTYTLDTDSGYSASTSGTTVTVSLTSSETLDTEGQMTELSSTVKNAFGISSSDYDTSEPYDTYTIEVDSSGNATLTITDNSYETVATEYNRNEMTLNYDHATGAYTGATFKQADTTENGITYTDITTDKIILNFNPDMDDSVNPWTDVYLDLSTTTNYNSSGTSTLQASKGDLAGNNTGRMMGKMTGISISKDGKISASYSNGQTLLLAQIASATFANASGLEKAGNNLYTATLNSGDPVVADITVGGGSISTGVLEMSNVDLSNEFTNMITAQRGFQANSRIITVSDTLLEELTNLKR
ncbi:MAG: flagellar hook-basal body complex protein [Butyrivibrio sp.]|uniref:flagellar hook-basal body complex protein n=1 Tax=Butyrivibrio sp. TaxID=28121 RepID=UPI0025D7525F|nr:flagellar hook-basal body complex protein [Butyrivibrio sp.]MCR5772258.1 flagellar hook-basal body complex protein [Butyrivibrio sp.]